MCRLMNCIPHPSLLGDRIEKNEMGWVCGKTGGKENAFVRFWCLKPKENGRRGRPRRRCEDNIKMDPQ